LQIAIAACRLDQREIASRLGYTQGRISQILNGCSPVSKRFAILFSAAFGVSEAWLINGSGNMDDGRKYQASTEMMEIERQLSELSQVELRAVRQLLHKLKQEKQQG
jgi:plasmid maintenance system antidote protein VapI